jgi:hypothetical protein
VQRNHFEKKESVGLPTDRFLLSDQFPPTRLIFPGEILARVLKVIPSTGEQALQAYAKACGKPLNCHSGAVWIFENR